MILKKWVAGILFTLVIACADAQIIRVGLNVGAQASWVTVDDPKFKEANVRPVPGFHAGPVFAFKVKDRYFLNL
jgi:hypothetical protein